MRNLDRPALALDRRACARALDACRDAREALELNPNETLLLERLMLHLPGAAASHGTTTLPGTGRTPR